MKKTLLTMAAAVALVGCSQEDLLENESNENNQAVAFESYLGKSVQSRAAVVTTETLKVDGFAVNAYYTKDATFNADEASDYDVFMNNTKVTFNKEKEEWTYSPVKYWPNISGHKVSFFAYAPYGDGNIKVQEGNFSKINFTVNPDVLKQVDFIYNDQTADNKTIDRSKQDVTGNVNFLFKHALARIGFSVQVVVDETDANNSMKLDGNTHIDVKKVELLDKNSETTDAFYTEGTFNMATGTWDATPNGFQGFTFAGANFDRTVTVGDDEVVQLHKFNQKQTLLNEKSYLMIIPQDLSGEDNGFKIRITYDVITEGEDGDNSTVTNTITSKEALKVNFEQGKAYNFNLILGMTSVKFDASVAEWVDANEQNPIWLPVNTPVGGE